MPIKIRKDSSQTWLALIGQQIVGYYTLTRRVVYSDAPEALAKGCHVHAGGDSHG